MPAWLQDSNILLRFVKPDDRDYPLVCAAVEELWARGDTLYYTSQNLGEFWNTCTRPLEQNGYGLSVVEANRRAHLIEVQFSLLPDLPEVHHEWRRLLVECSVSGAQVHDARLAAAMRVHAVSHILTFNSRDFTRYVGITAVHPRDLTPLR